MSEKSYECHDCGHEVSCLGDEKPDRCDKCGGRLWERMTMEAEAARNTRLRVLAKVQGFLRGAET